MTAVIIPTYNRYETTRGFLLTKLPWGWWVIVADGGSPDGTPQKVRAEFPVIDVLVVRTASGPGWWSHCVNAGVKRARRLGAERILITNDDAVFTPDVVESLEKAARNYPDQILQVPIKYMGRYFVGGRKTWRDLVPNPEHKFKDIDWLSGQCLYAKADVFRDVGPFDEECFPQYFGDADWCLRARQKGHVLGIAWGAAIVDRGLCAHNEMKRESLWRQFRSKRSSFYLPARYHLYKRHWRFWPLPFAVFLLVAVVKTAQSRIKSWRTHGHGNA